MEKDFKEAVDKSKKAMASLEKQVEELASDFGDSANEVWADLKKSLTKIGAKLDNASSDIEKKEDDAILQAHLGAMEARENMKEVKESIEDFTTKVMDSAQVGLDTAVVKAHLAKMEAEDYWEKEGKGIKEEFSNSKEKVSKLALEAMDEISEFFETLTSDISKKKA